MPKPHITFIMHNIMGGVVYMNHQIIKHSELYNFFDVHVILFKIKERAYTRFSEKFEGSNVVEFEYSIFDNYYLVLKRLNKLLNKHQGIIVTNDGIEMDALQMFGTKSLIYSIVHDFYNLRVAISKYKMVDVFLCHTETFAKTLQSSGRAIPRVDYLPHGVEIPKISRHEISDRKALKLLFIGRLVKSKGCLLLKDIDSALSAKGIQVDWTIIGNGELKDQLLEQWKGAENVSFLNPSKNDEVMSIAQDCDVFVSPSSFEGYGIALLEAMACGLVPVVFDLPVGIPAQLPPNVGFKIKDGVNEFAEKIETLHKDRVLLNNYKHNARLFVETNHDITVTAKAYRKSFQNPPENSHKSFLKEISLLGFFDRKYLPNNIAVFAKKYLKKNI